MLALTRAQIRSIDERCIKDFAIPGIVLMENAGLNLTRAVRRALAELEAGAAARVAIVCGRGNNGGDGLVLARHLANAGQRPVVLYLGALEPRPQGNDAAVNLEIARRMALEIHAVSSAEQLSEQLSQRWAVVCDAYLGTGLSAALKPAAVSYIEAMNAAAAPIIAVDIPSGLDCDEGRPLGAAVRAWRTVTMAALKRGFSQAGAAQYTGTVELVEIGAPRQLLESFARTPA